MKFQLYHRFIIALALLLLASGFLVSSVYAAACVIKIKVINNTNLPVNIEYTGADLPQAIRHLNVQPHQSVNIFDDSLVAYLADTTVYQRTVKFRRPGKDYCAYEEVGISAIVAYELWALIKGYSICLGSTNNAAAYTHRYDPGSSWGALELEVTLNKAKCGILECRRISTKVGESAHY